MEESVKEVEVPSFFVCPISLDTMKDPVTFSTGITYDRESIEKWLYTMKNSTCPVTKQALTDIELTPNHTVRRLIQSWCTINAPSGIQRIPTPRLPVSKSEILKLLQDSKSSSLQMKCLKRLKTVVLESDMNKRSVEAVGGADYLAYIIINNPSDKASPSDEAVSILYHLRLSETSLKALWQKNGDLVQALTRVLQHAASYESRTYAMLLLKSIMEVAEPFQLMSLKPDLFIEVARILINQISRKATKAAIKLLISVCPWGRNKVKIVEAGVIPVLVETLLECNEKRMTEMALTLLHQLCLCADGRAGLLKHGAGLAVIGKKIFRVSAIGSEMAVRILHSVAKYSGSASVIQEMLHLGIVGKLCFVLQADYCGSKTSEKAREILKMHGRVWKNSSCIPYNIVSCYPC